MVFIAYSQSRWTHVTASFLSSFIFIFWFGFVKVSKVSFVHMTCEMAERHVCYQHIYIIKQLPCSVGHTQSETGSLFVIHESVDVCEAGGTLFLGCIDNSVSVQLQ